MSKACQVGNANKTSLREVGSNEPANILTTFCFLKELIKLQDKAKYAWKNKVKVDLVCRWKIDYSFWCKVQSRALIN